MVDASLLFDASKKIPEPKIPKVGELGFKEAMGISEPYMEKKRELQPKIAGADAAIEEAKRKQKLVEVTGESTAIKKQAEDVRTAQDTYQTQLEAEPLPAFIPDKESAKDIAGLFSMVSVMGMLLGGGGKLNAMQALNAMNGMLEGHQKGRADLYKKQATEFDKNFKSMLKKHEEFRKKMEDAIKLAAVDKEAGMADARMAAVESGSNIIKAMLDKGNLVGAYKALDESQALAENAFKTVINEQDKAETRRLAADREASAERRYLANREAAERRHKEDRDAAERRHRESMAQRERMAKEKMSHADKVRGLKGIGKAASATNERYANTVLRSSNEVLRSLELIERLGITTGGGVLGGVVGKGTIPSEVQRYIGQTFTEEGERNYNIAMSGLALELAYVLGGGYKPDVNTVNKLETLLSVGPNSTYGNAAYSFADVTAKLKAAVETSPAYTDDQKVTKEKILEKLNKYATPEQVQDRIYGKGRTEEPAVRAGKTYEPKTAEEFKAVPPGELYIDPGDRKTYRKPK
jgi:hypothetical protein